MPRQEDTGVSPSELHIGPATRPLAETTPAHDSTVNARGTCEPGWTEERTLSRLLRRRRENRNGNEAVAVGNAGMVHLENGRVHDFLTAAADRRLDAAAVRDERSLLELPRTEPRRSAVHAARPPQPRVTRPQPGQLLVF